MYGHMKQKVVLANAVIDRGKAFIEKGFESSARTKAFVEFPEDLGARRYRGEWVSPASLWRCWRAMLDKIGATSAAHHTCQWNGKALKPERTASNIAGHDAIGYPGWPVFDDSGQYKGPLPRHCDHPGGHQVERWNI